MQNPSSAWDIDVVWSAEVALALGARRHPHRQPEEDQERHNSDDSCGREGDAEEELQRHQRQQRGDQRGEERFLVRL